jgi:hypothetical protein
MTADFGDERQFLRNAGFGTIIAAEDISKFRTDKKYPSTYGYWDEGTSTLSHREPTDRKS